MRLVYKKDLDGKEILQDEDEIHDIMMEWEKPYMEFSIEKIKPFGKVLEIGFGLGYSASKICSFNEVDEYNIIECNPVVWNKIELWRENIKKERKELKINLIKGRWEDVLETLDIFDTIYFDDYNGESLTEAIVRGNRFLYEIVNYHMKIGSKVSYYSSINKNMLHNVNCLEFELHTFNINIPKGCKYAEGNEMYVPIYKLINEKDIDLKKKILGNYIESNKRLQNQLLNIKKNINKTRPIYCNLLVIDNFYTNAMETRNYILGQEFSVRGNYPGQRTISYANNELRDIIEKYIVSFAGKIIDWPQNKESYNGAYQYTTARDRTWIHTDGHNNWAGVLYLTPSAPLSSGTGFFKYKDGTRFEEDSKNLGNEKQIGENSQDYTKWELVDQVGNIFNRLVLFNSKQFHASLDYFGTNKENGRLFQVFFFTTER